jgi:magnesium-transporting ATPase (P-type)
MNHNESTLVSVLIGHLEDAISIALTIFIVLSGWFYIYLSGICAGIPIREVTRSAEETRPISLPCRKVIATKIRNGIMIDELASNLVSWPNLKVAGDLIRIHYGDRIPADARLINVFCYLI